MVFWYVSPLSTRIISLTAKTDQLLGVKCVSRYLHLSWSTFSVEVTMNVKYLISTNAVLRTESWQYNGYVCIAGNSTIQLQKKLGIYICNYYIMWKRNYIRRKIKSWQKWHYVTEEDRNEECVELYLHSPTRVPDVFKQKVFTFFTLYFNIILQPTLLSPQWTLLLRLSDQNSERVFHSPKTCYMCCPCEEHRLFHIKGN